MKHTMKLVGIVIASIVLVACGGGSDPVKTEKVWRLKEQVTSNKKITFDYDGSGNLIRQNHGGLEANSLEKYFEFDYDDEGVLLTRKNYSVSTGKLTRLIKFDGRGEMVQGTRGDANGEPIMPADTVYINTYNNSDRDRDEEKKLVQRKIIKITADQPQYFYLGSKLVSRVRSGTAEGVVYHTVEGNKLTTEWFKDPDDGIVDNSTVTTFNDHGDEKLIVFNGKVYLNAEYTYDVDANGNLEKSVMTNLINGSVLTTHYTWEQMDIPVK